VREALLREWSLTPWSSAHDDLLAQLVRSDAEWIGRLAPLSPDSAMKSALTAAARELPASSVERLAVTVASSSVAGRGWALRCVLFPCGLPAEEVAAIIGRHFELFARDDGWTRSIARETGAALHSPAEEVPKRRRR
jgi:hypothetical protein